MADTQKCLICGGELLYTKELDVNICSFCVMEEQQKQEEQVRTRNITPVPNVQEREITSKIVYELSKEQIKDRLFRLFHSWMTGKTVSIDGDGEVIYSQKDVDEFCRRLSNG